MEKTPRMLEGYRVLDFTHFVAGPTCTRILGEMGADVIKVERSKQGDHVRVLGLVRDGMSSYYFQHNHSKRSLALDFQKPEAKEIILKLIPKIDVVVENFAPGVIAAMGFGYEALKKINPKIIMVSVSVAGQTGPLSSKPGYDYLGQSLAGVTDQIGEAEGTPVTTPMAIGDISTGVSAAMAVGFALLHRERTGEGNYIDASLLDTYFHMHELSVPIVSMRPGKWAPKRTGAMHPTGAPCGVFQAKDGFVFIVIQQHEIGRLWKAMGRPELANRSALSHQSRSDEEQRGAQGDHRDVARHVSRSRLCSRRARQSSRPLRAGLQVGGIDGASAYARAQNRAPGERSAPRRFGNPRHAGEIFQLARQNGSQGLETRRR
jgi:CoA:oxalate CoA-transferase